MDTSWPTVQLDDGALIVVCSYRGKGQEMHLKVIRWKLPVGKEIVG